MMNIILKTPLILVIISPPPYIVIDSYDWCVYIVTGRNDIPEADFPAHVKQMHLDRDHKLEIEYKVCLLSLY